ncbi:adenylate/guanylate cyclase domain-containing protein [Acuticoccus kandeliae]|uniref:adenylate/guanylate cyclase domain-containing protein n=1 Tax=Acuticoccus kandeliae TaxID=2073160 RepID=UPI000D3EB426|nr:adenylate/guanylate cyclase domain-containing protein [Acuticoccus kandeliae]
MSAAAARTERRGEGLARVAIIAAAAALGLLIGQRFEPVAGDLLLALTAPAPDPRIVIVAIDEATVATLPVRSPIDRAFLADLVTTIDKAGPAAIGLDLLLDEPTEPQKDAALAAAIEAAAAPVVVAVASAGAANAFPGEAGDARLPRDRRDGTVRAMPEAADAFAARLARAGGATAVPDGRIVFAEGDFVRYPAHTVRLLPPAWLADKFVLVGTTLDGIDQHRIPTIAMRGADEGVVPGVRVHADILAQILAGRALRPPSWAVLAASAVLAALLGAMVRPFGPLSVLAGGAAALALYAGIVVAVAAVSVSILPIATPMAAFVLSAGGNLGQRLQSDRRERLRMRAMFGRYVNPRVVDRLVDSGTDPALGGERREITHLFTDLEGFTALAEGLEPEVTAAVLNTYLDGIITRILAKEGTVDKLVGDAVVAFFGAPDAQSDHASRAVDAAREIAAFTEAMRGEWAAKGVRLGATRVGVHTGVAVVGNFGGRHFFDYTAIGDSVNVAARLEGANRTIGTRVLVSAATRAEAAGDYRRVGRIRVKGRRETVEVFEPVAAPDADYEAAFAALEGGDGGAGFKRLAAVRPDDPLVAFQARRLAAGAVDDLVVETA